MVTGIGHDEAAALEAIQGNPQAGNVVVATVSGHAQVAAESDNPLGEESKFAEGRHSLPYGYGFLCVKRSLIENPF